MGTRDTKYAYTGADRDALTEKIRQDLGPELAHHETGDLIDLSQGANAEASEILDEIDGILAARSAFVEKTNSADADDTHEHDGTDGVLRTFDDRLADARKRLFLKDAEGRIYDEAASAALE